jgi:hypothetical protein
MRARASARVITTSGRLPLGEYDGLPRGGKLPRGGGWNSPVGGEYNVVMNKLGMSYGTSLQGPDVGQISMSKIVSKIV